MRIFRKQTPEIPLLKQEYAETVQEGYEEIKSILSDWVLIQFSVPDHVWNELQKSKEWKDFQALLEKHQTEHIRKYIK